MWWINQNGNIEGPLSTEQIERRVKINMLRSLDKISNDKIKWIYVKDSRFWNSSGKIKSTKPQSGVYDRLMEDEISDKVTPPRFDCNTLDSGGSPVIQDRFRLNDQSPAKSPNRRFLAALIIGGCIAGFFVVGVAAYFIVSHILS